MAVFGDFENYNILSFTSKMQTKYTARCLNKLCYYALVLQTKLGIQNLKIVFQKWIASNTYQCDTQHGIAWFDRSSLRQFKEHRIYF